MSRKAYRYGDYWSHDHSITFIADSSLREGEVRDDLRKFGYAKKNFASNNRYTLHLEPLVSSGAARNHIQSATIGQPDWEKHYTEEAKYIESVREHGKRAGWSKEHITSAVETYQQRMPGIIERRPKGRDAGAQDWARVTGDLDKLWTGFLKFVDCFFFTIESVHIGEEKGPEDIDDGK